MSDMKLRDEMKHLGKLSNVKHSEVMIAAIVNIIQVNNKDVNDFQAYRVARSVLSY